MEEEANSEQSNSQSDDQFDPVEKREKGRKGLGKKLSPGKRAPTQTRATQGSSKVLFDSQIPAEETEQKICELFGDQLVEAAMNDLIISENLSVRDLRVIIRVLDLMTAEQVNVRKSILIECIQNFLKGERMKEVYSKYLEEMEERGEIEKERADEIRKRHAVLEPVEIVKVEEPVKVKAPPSPVRRRSPSTSALASESGGKRVAVPRFRLDPSVSIDEQLAFISEMNQFVVNVNRNLCEMERIASVLADRCAELAEDLKL